MNEKRAIETLRKIKKILDKNNINYWLDEGSLLGAVREKKLIKWDHDIDLSIWYTDFEKIKILFDEINKTGVQAFFLEGQKHINLLDKGYKIDINLYHLEDNKATRIWYTHNKLGRILDYFFWTLNVKNAELINSKMPLLITKFLVAFIKKLPNLIKIKINKTLLNVYKNKCCKPIKMGVPSHFFKDLSTLDFYGMKFKVPKKTEEYLEYRYGKNWKTPKKDYVFHRDDNSIVKNK